jgi:hypothetical protein
VLEEWHTDLLKHLKCSRFERFRVLSSGLVAALHRCNAVRVWLQG